MRASRTSGYKPTVGGETRKGVETYLFDLDRDLYGEVLDCAFLRYERPERKFASLEELKKRIETGCGVGTDILRPVRVSGNGRIRIIQNKIRRNQVAAC